jgi:uncharacterized protein YbaR (Trm112 family)
LFIELSEFLRCPEPHEESFCVVAPDEMVGRVIVRGIVGCPACKREYPIRDGVVDFGAAAAAAAAAEAAEAADPDVVWASLGLTSPGGFVVLVGSACRLATALGERLGGVHFVGLNPTMDVGMSPGLSLLRHPGCIPLRQSMARGVVLGAEAAREPWISEGARVLLDGLRLVAVAEALSAPGLDRLAEGRGLWVGQKAGKASRKTGRRPTADSR